MHIARGGLFSGRSKLSKTLFPFLLCLVLVQAASAQRARSALGIYDPKTNPAIAAGALPNAAAVAAGVGAAVGEAASLASFSSAAKLVVEEDGFPAVKDNQGPLYTEPAWNLGEGNHSVGLGYSHLEFEEFEGTSLDKVFDFPGVDNDFDLSADVWVLSYGRGITDKLDIFFLFPFVRLDGDGALGTGLSYDEEDFGLGDVVLRTKYQLKTPGDSAFSIGGDLIFPTGDEDEYLGGGGMGYRIRTLYGKRIGKIYPTVELGYLWTNIQGDSRLRIDESDFNKFEYRLGIPYEVSERCTLSLEWIGSISEAFTQNDLGLSGRWDMKKFKEGMVIDLGLRIPVDDDGLRTDLTPTVALEYRF